MESESLLMRADASLQIGTGHVMRCLALAQAWHRRGGHIIFATAMPAPALEARLHAEHIEVVHLAAQPGSDEDAVQTATLAQQRQSVWVVVDGYHFTTNYQRIIKDAGQQLFVIDDYGHTQHYYADIVLNQNLHAHAALYTSRAPDSRLLLGARYLLLRREFLQEKDRSREMPTAARRVLVTLGGSDPENVTATAIQALQHVRIDGLAATVVVGGSNPHLAQLREAIEKSRVPIHLEHNVANLATLMRWADIAISAAGSTAWELAFMGLPSLLIVEAENQRAIAEQLERVGAAHSLGWHGSLTACDIAWRLSAVAASGELLCLMTQRGLAVVDGNGADRVVMAMRGDPFRLRDVHDDDCRRLWEWATDPDVRAVSFSSTPIPWEHHRQWFYAKLRDPRCLFHIATDSADVPVGQVRYDREGDQAVISVSLDRQQRNRGYGSLLLRLSAQRVFATTALTLIHAYIKPENLASIRAFEKAGYTHAGTTNMTGQPAVHLTVEKSSASRGMP